MRRRAGPARRGLAVGAVDETGQVKQGEHTAGVKRHYLGCAGKVANGITTVHLAYVREQAGHALIAARQWIPAEQIGDPATSLAMGLPPDLAFRTKGQLAIDLLTEAFADGVRVDLRLRRRGLRQLHPAARLPGRPRPGLCAAGPVELPPHRGPRGDAVLQASGRPAAGRRPPLGGPLRREGIQR